MAKNNMNQWSLTFLRVVLGFVFVYHGYLKLFVSGGFTGTVDFFTSIGLPLPLYAALVASVVEFVGGLFLLFGVITKWTSLALVLEMLIAFFVVHLKNGLLVSKGGYEFVLVLIAALVVLFANGSGKLSLGKKLFKNKQLH